MRSHQRLLDYDSERDLPPTAQKPIKQILAQNQSHRDMLLCCREDGFSVLFCIDVRFQLDLMPVSPKHVLNVLIKVFCSDWAGIQYKSNS
ncbi:hypothetical protein NECAME_04830 [Necator americanus]|uniref:Uncharacterized protein n=1 Tax=Necator americanus TaxID=51031 RepID=W2SPP4_NECAM|nr:hypothetical protein NECAME_04830 [Necator americanus]ETN70672.1 hypothetical protein NECAME_04830 [Necator americanus]